MKSFLIVAVIGVWSAIIYRIVHGLHSSGSIGTPAVVATPHEWREVQDSFSLYADYPDPFLADEDSSAGEPVANKVAIPAPAVAAAAIPAVPKEPITNIIQFNGVITNPQKGLRIAIITVHGRQFLVKEREKVEGVTMRKIKKEEVVVVYQGSVYLIRK